MAIRCYKKILFSTTLALLLCLAGFVVIETIGNYNRELHSYVSSANDMADQRMSTLYYEINDIPRGAGNDVLFLSKLANLKTFINDPQSTQAKNNLEQDFKDFLKQNQTYKNIVLINNQGIENLDVYAGNLKPQAANHSDKDYFTKTISLNRDEVYISELGVDAQGDASSSPVMKYGTPVFGDASTKPAGALIITVNAGYFLDDIRNFARDGEQMVLIDNSGRYLANSDHAKEFFSSGDQYNFSRDYPDVASEVLKNSDGARYAENQSWYFTFRYIRPTISSFEIYNGSKGENYYWVLVNINKKDGQNAVIGDIKTRHFLFLGLCLFLIASAVAAAYALAFKDKKI